MADENTSGGGGSGGLLPIVGSVFNGIGNALSGGGGGSAPTTSTWIGSYPQMQLFEMLVNAARQGRGDYGFGAAARAGMETVRQQMANRGISQSSGVYQSGLANMLGQAVAADAQGRRNFAVQAATMSPWTVTSNKLGDPGYWTWGGDQSYAQRLANGGRGSWPQYNPGPRADNRHLFPNAQ